MKGRISKILAVSIAALVVAVQIFAVPICASALSDEDYQYAPIIRGGIYVMIPKGWQVIETGDFEEDVDLVVGGDPIYEIMELRDANGNEQGQLWAFADLDSGEFFFTSREEDLQEYYEEAGHDALTEILNTALGDVTLDEDSVSYLESEDTYACTARVNASSDGKDYLIYLSCESTGNGVVHEAMIFDQIEDQARCDRIGCSVQGYGYAMNLAEGDYPGTDVITTPEPQPKPDLETWRDYDIGGLLGVLVNVIIWAGLAIVCWKVIRARTRAGEQTGEFANRMKIGKTRKTDGWVSKEAGKGLRHPKHDDCQVHETVRYSGYKESLKTLHRSGLLTTKEMNELLEKHINDI